MNGKICGQMEDLAGACGVGAAAFEERKYLAIATLYRDRQKPGGPGPSDVSYSAEWRAREDRMHWIVRIECEAEDGEHPSSSEAIRIERPRLEIAGDVGLTLEDGKRIMAALQRRVVADQLREYCDRSRRCSSCGAARPLKDRRRRVIDTVFGRVTVASPRYKRCRCGSHHEQTAPVSGLIPSRVLPELLRLQAKLGADLPYRRAAAILRTFLPEATCFSHATTRNRVIKVGQAIEDELHAEMAHRVPPLAPAQTMVVGIDGCFVKGIRGRRKTNLEIVLGRVEVPCRGSEVFAVVRHLDGRAKERVRTVLRRCGRTPDTAVTILSDGEDGMRTMLGRWLDPTVMHRLDWWHLYRRLEKMRKALLYLPFTSDRDWRDRLRAETWAIEHIRWTLWNGCTCVYLTDCAITQFCVELEIHRRAVLSAGREVDRIDHLLEQLAEFRRYLYGNAESLVNYNHARIAGERVSTAHVESTVNELVNWRMCKKQQMRWSPLGAQLLLHVRVAALNGCLERYAGSRSTTTAPANDDQPIAKAA